MATRTEQNALIDYFESRKLNVGEAADVCICVAVRLNGKNENTARSLGGLLATNLMDTGKEWDKGKNERIIRTLQKLFTAFLERKTSWSRHCLPAVTSVAKSD
jgi:hypothetical protein